MSIAEQLTLRRKAIRRRILGVGADWVGLGGVWLLGTQPNQKPIRTRAFPGTKQRAMRRMVTYIATNELLASSGLRQFAIAGGF